MEKDLPDVQPGSRKGQGSGDIIADAYWIKKCQRISKRNHMCFINYRKTFDCVMTSCEICSKNRIPEYLIVLLRNLYTAHEALE